MDVTSDEPAFGGPFDLDSPLSSVIDEPRAYRALLDTVGKHDPDRLATLRRYPVWTRGQTVRLALMFAPPALSDDVVQALSDVTSRDWPEDVTEKETHGNRSSPGRHRPHV
jgi:alpha-L-rhamnosidase